MAISYNKLWKLLVDKKMSKADLRNAGRLNRNNFNRLNLLGLVDLVAAVNIGTIHVAVSLTSGKSEKRNCRNQQFCFDHG